jgi:hypothetical protein
MDILVEIYFLFYSKNFMIHGIEHKQRAYIEGVDGSGKTKTAHGVAQVLGEQYPNARIQVADSSGVVVYRNGETIAKRFGWLESMEPRSNVSHPRMLAQLVGFTAVRRAANIGSTDLLLSARDPHRINPAVYAKIYIPELFGRLSAAARLALFDHLTYAPPADRIIHLQTPDAAMPAIVGLPEGVEVDPHETPEKMAIALYELPLVLSAYMHSFGTPVSEVAALTPTTVDQAAALLEPLLAA